MQCDFQVKISRAPLKQSKTNLVAIGDKSVEHM